MATDYLQNVSTRKTPQSEPIPGRTDMTENSAGGFGFEVNDTERVRRFLILGSEGGSYYASESKLTAENAATVIAMAKADGPALVALICTISESGRAPKNDPAIFALAIASSLGNDETRKLALDSLQDVCRTGTHLFTFIKFVRQFRGWGRGLRRAVAAWYQDKDPGQLSYQMVKYRQREGYSHRDLLRLAHPKAMTSERSELYGWAVGKAPEGQLVHERPQQIVAFERAQKITSGRDAAALLRQFGKSLPREAIPTEFASTPEVWEALLDVGLPQTALLRNLANLTRVEVLKPMGDRLAAVCAQITDADRLIAGRVHPISILGALLTYGRGQGVRGSNVWTPLSDITDALDSAFYTAFGSITPNKKRHMLALDVSGSMSFGDIAGMPGLTPRVGSAAMALVTAATEPHKHIMAFSHDFVPLNISPRMRLDDAVRAVSGLSFGGTDCALPMLYALKHKIPVDAFIIYTDSETWFGGVHPIQALQEYRRVMDINAKLVVVGMVSNGFSIADPTDGGMLDVVGFDTATPNLISEFVSQ